MAEETNPNVVEETVEQEKRYTDADVDAIIGKKLAKWSADSDKKLEQAVADAVAKVEEANKLAQMTEKEKADHEREEERKELAMLRAEKARSEMVRTARQILKADGLTDLPDELVNILVTEDADSTSAAVKAFSGLFQKAVDDAVKHKLAGSEPRRGGTSAITKDEILAVKNDKERVRLINENIHLFQDMLNGGK